MRAVVDTNILISALINRQGTPGKVLLLLRNGSYTIIYSESLLIEIVEVLSRPRIRTKYSIRSEDIRALIDLIHLRGEFVIPHKKITICRDPKDNYLLAAAAEGVADCIVSGDSDLLDLGNAEGIPILKPAEFLNRLT